VSRESNQSRYNQKADVFSLGCALFTMVTGEVPFRDPRVELQSGEMVENVAYIQSLLEKVDDPGKRGGRGGG
jgi:serine/threonine protein kinase